MAQDARGRPEQIPAEAWLSDKCGLWSLGPKNDAGELDGDVHYWDSDGTLVSIAHKKNGVAHGPARRFHDNGEVAQTCEYVEGKLHGTRTFFPNSPASARQMSLGDNVRRAEYYYDDQGRLTGACYFDGDSEAVERDGRVLLRPPGVPDDAIAGEGGTWASGTWDDDNRKQGEFRFFGKDGRLEGKETYEDGVLHGRTCYLSDAGQTLRESQYWRGLLDGPDETFYQEGGRRGSYVYEAGRLRRAEQFYRDGTLARRAELQDGSFEDYARNGELLGVRRRPELPRAAALLDPPEDLLDALEGAEPERLDAASLSPRQVADVVSLAFGGDINRDAELARAARRVVRGHPDPGLQAMLRQTGLDTAPRIHTLSRVRRLLAGVAGCAAVDVPHLEQSLACQGGPAERSALETPTALAVSLLEKRCRGRDRLRLSHLGLRVLPSAIRYLPLLRALDASGNEIDLVPPEICELLLLAELRLSANRIDTLPPELARLGELSRLMLGDNALAAVPEVVCSLPELRTLELGHNRITRLPERFGALRRLDTLWLNDNPLQTLPDRFGELSSLTFLHLGGAAWTRPPDVVFELSALKTLWLSSPSLEHLPHDIGRLKNLERLSLWFSGLGEVPGALFEMTHLRELRIRHNPLPEQTIQLLKEALPDCTIL